MATHRNMVLTHADWSSPNSFTNGMVNVTDMILPTGDKIMRKMESRSCWYESLVIMVESDPYGTLIAV